MISSPFWFDSKECVHRYLYHFFFQTLDGTSIASAQPTTAHVYISLMLIALEELLYTLDTPSRFQGNKGS
jgi:hypothetical protein